MRFIAETSSLLLSVSGVLLCVWFLLNLRGKACIAFSKRVKDSADWMIMGIVINHLFDALDSSYWLLPWSADYINSDSSTLLFSIGVYFNIFFRNIPLILSSYCHMRGFFVFLNDDAGINKLNRVLFIGFGVGSLYVGLLLLVKGFY